MRGHITSPPRAFIDPYGGIWTLWPLFGTGNQMLAAIALMFCTAVLFNVAGRATEMQSSECRCGHFPGSRCRTAERPRSERQVVTRA
jgi:hypothetical protein